MLLLGLVLDTAALQALIAANPLIAAVLAIAVVVLGIKEWPNIKTMFARITGQPTAVTDTSVSTESADGTTTQTVKTKSSSIFPSLSAVIDDINNSDIVKRLNVDRNTILQMVFADGFMVYSSWVQKDSGWDDAVKASALEGIKTQVSLLANPVPAPSTTGGVINPPAPATTTKVL